MGLKHYVKEPKTKIKKEFFNSDRGVYEKDDGSPAGHSRKYHAQITFTGVPPAAGIVIPAGYTAYITMVDWAVLAAPAIVGEVYSLNDGTNYISAYGIDTTTDPYVATQRYGNGSGIIGKATGTINITAHSGPTWGTAQISFTYYLKPTV